MLSIGIKNVRTTKHKFTFINMEEQMKEDEEKSRRCDAIYEEIILIELNEIKKHRKMYYVDLEGNPFGLNVIHLTISVKLKTEKMKKKRKKTIQKTSEHFQYKLLCIYTI